MRHQYLLINIKYLQKDQGMEIQIMEKTKLRNSFCCRGKWYLKTCHMCNDVGEIVEKKR